MKTAIEHLARKPNCRPSTLRFIELRNAKLEQLRRELSEAEQRDQLSMIGRLMRKLGWKS
jgi:hypothetical protein